jgi:hypothetical protein
MRRLLTGYAVTFNRRHRRSSHLFQNRYKSVLCQQDPNLLELVRYLHLNPLRTGLVSSMKQVKELEIGGADIARRLKISQSAVSRAVARGERIAAEMDLSLMEK